MFVHKRICAFSMQREQNCIFRLQDSFSEALCLLVTSSLFMNASSSCITHWLFNPHKWFLKHEKLTYTIDKKCLSLEWYWNSWLALKNIVLFHSGHGQYIFCDNLYVAFFETFIPILMRLKMFLIIWAFVDYIALFSWLMQSLMLSLSL